AYPFERREQFHIEPIHPAGFGVGGEPCVEPPRCVVIERPIGELRQQSAQLVVEVLAEVGAVHACDSRFLVWTHSSSVSRMRWSNSDTALGVLWRSCASD